MRTLLTLVLCGAFSAAQDTAKLDLARGAVVGVQARRMIDMRGRQFPVNMRQVGVVVGEDGLVFTTSLGQDPENVRVFLPGTTEAVDAEVVDSDDSFTILRVEELDAKPIEFARGWQPAMGQKLIWVGLIAGAGGKWTAVARESRVDAIIKDDSSSTPIVYSDPPFNGPVTTLCGLVLNGAGEPVGVVTQRQAQDQQGGGRGMRMMRGGGGIPVIMPAAGFAQYLGGSVVKRGMLGVSVETLAEKVAEAMGLMETRGVIVTQVTPGSGAEKAGIVSQDVIVKVDGVATTDQAGLQKALRGKAADTVVTVTIARLTEKGVLSLDYKVTLTARQESDKSQRFKAPRFGFTAEPLNAAIRRNQQLPAELNGVHVRRVVNGGPASMGRPTGLRRGDIILRVGQVPVTDIDSLKAALKAVADGTPAALFVRNGKDTRFVEIKPEKG